MLHPGKNTGVRNDINAGVNPRPWSDGPRACPPLVQELDSRSSAPVHIEAQVDDLQLNDEVALSVFRITQEALNNAIQHADASEIAVRLTQYPDRLRLTVTDDG